MLISQMAAPQGEVSLPEEEEGSRHRHNYLLQAGFTTGAQETVQNTPGFLLLAGKSRKT